VTQDPQAFRTAIDEAINSETFQTAIAANLARLIKPSIKDALDTLQPVVEAVYSHEVLLRKTNRSVEDILIRLDTNQSQHTVPPSPGGPGSPRSPGTPSTTRPRKSSEASNGQGQDIEQFKASLEKNNKRTVATLAELSSAVEGNNRKVAEVVERIEDIQATLIPTKEGLDSMKSFSDTANTNTAVMQAQLDQLKADIGLIIDAIGPDLSQKVKSIHEQVGAHPSLLAGHTTKLDAISTDLVALKGQADVVEKIQSVSADLDAFKSYIEGNITKRDELFSGLGSQVGNVLTVVEGHTGTLAEIKEANASPAILEAVQKSNNSHESHAIVLGEIKERSIAPGPTEAAPAGGVPVSAAALEALKADIAALKENIESGLSSHNENLTGLGTKVDGVLTVVEGHKAADQSADILAAVQKSNDSHASHSEALEGVKGLGSPAPAYDTNFAALEAQIVALQTTLHSHTGALDEIKSTKALASTELVPAEGASSSGLDAEIGSIIATLEAHTGLLNEIKDDVSAEILTALHDIGQTQAGHSNILTEILEADVSDEILTALHASNESHAGHTAALQQLNDSHTAHSASLDELKTRSVEPAASGEAPTEAGNLGALETQIATLVSSLEEHKTTLAEIKEGTNASNESHASHATSLDEIKSRAVEPAPSTGINTEALEAQIAALSTTLEEHKTTLSAIHEATNTLNASHAAHAASLEEIKSRSVEPAPAGETSDAGPQIGSIIATLEEQNATLAAIKDTTAASHELHVSHIAALGEIKDAIANASDFHTSHATTLGEIKEATSGLGDLHASHTTALGEIKDLHASHATILGEIKDATTTSNESHAAHTATLAELKSIQPGETTRSAPESPDLPAMEAHFTNILSTLEAQNGTLAEIKDSAANPELLSTVKQSHELLSSHTPLLESIKEGTSHEDILSHISELKSSIEESKAGVDAHGSIVKDLHADTKSSHSELTQAIGALALGGAAGAGAGALTSHDDKSSEVLEEVKAVRAIVEKSSSSIEGTEEKVTSITSQIDINHTTITTSITTLSDELKAEIDATGTQITDSLNVLSTDVKGIDISTLHTSMDGCSQEIKSISAALESHVSEGVHLNEKGLGQLKEHSSSSSERGEPMPEGAWFKKSGSPVLPRQIVESEPQEKEYNYLSPVAEEQTPTQEETPIIDDAPLEIEKEAIHEQIPEEAKEEEIPAHSVVQEQDEARSVPEEQPAAHEVEPKPAQEQESAADLSQEKEVELEPEIVKEQEIEPELAQEKETEPEPVQEEDTEPNEPAHEAEHLEPEVEEPAPAPVVEDEPPAPEPESKDPFPEPEEESPGSKTEEIEPEQLLESKPKVAEAEDEPAFPETEPLPALEQESEVEEPVPDSSHDEPEKEAELEPIEEPTHVEPEKESEPEPLEEPTHTTLEKDDAPSPEETMPSTPLTESETPSASTSAIASPSSPAFPLSPSTKKGGKKGKKEKKEKKEKKGGKKEKKEKVPFDLEGEDPEDD